jgi:hypothetical protein
MTSAEPSLETLENSVLWRRETCGSVFRVADFGLKVGPRESGANPELSRSGKQERQP